MNRREMLVGCGAGFFVTALMPEIAQGRKLTKRELAALKRIQKKIEAGEVRKLFSIKTTGMHKNRIQVEIEWTDRDVIMLRKNNVLG